MTTALEKQFKYCLNSIMIHPLSEVSEKAKLAPNVKIWNWVKVREYAEIGNSTSIGQCSYIDIGVKIGSRCKIQNGVQVYNGVEISDDVFIGPNVTFTNDLYPRAFTKLAITKTKVCQGASIGAGSVIVCGV